MMNYIVIWAKTDVFGRLGGNVTALITSNQAASEPVAYRLVQTVSYSKQWHNDDVVVASTDGPPPIWEPDKKRQEAQLPQRNSASAGQLMVYRAMHRTPQNRSGCIIFLTFRRSDSRSAGRKRVLT